MLDEIIAERRAEQSARAKRYAEVNPLPPAPSLYDVLRSGSSGVLDSPMWREAIEPAPTENG